jgi:hypothetical protein
LHRALKFLLVSGGLTLVVGAIGGLIATPANRAAVWLGSGIGFVVQLVMFGVLFGVAFRSHPLLAHGLGMIGRFLAIAAVAFLWVPWAGVPAAPLLFSLVTVFFLTTLVEPLLLLPSRT